MNEVPVADEHHVVNPGDTGGPPGGVRGLVRLAADRPGDAHRADELRCGRRRDVVGARVVPGGDEELLGGVVDAEGGAVAHVHLANHLGRRRVATSTTTTAEPAAT